MNHSEYISYAALQIELDNPKHEKVILHGRSHSDCMTYGFERYGVAYGSRDVSKDVYGFLTSTGRFVSRREAYDIALNAKQLKHPCYQNHELQSYNVIMGPIQH